MKWVYWTLAGCCAYAIVGEENLFSIPLFWIAAAVAVIRLVVVARRAKAAPKTALLDTGSTAASSAIPHLDMFDGMRNWTEDECAAEVAVAACSLSGRSPEHLRSILVAAVLRNDEPGRVVAAATRRLLRAEP